MVTHHGAAITIDGFDYGNKSTNSFDYGTKTTNSTGAHTHSVSGSTNTGNHTHTVGGRYGGDSIGGKHVFRSQGLNRFPV